MGGKREDRVVRSGRWLKRKAWPAHSRTPIRVPLLLPRVTLQDPLPPTCLVLPSKLSKVGITNNWTSTLRVIVLDDIHTTRKHELGWVIASRFSTSNQHEPSSVACDKSPSPLYACEFSSQELLCKRRISSRNSGCTEHHHSVTPLCWAVAR